MNLLTKLLEKFDEHVSDEGLLDIPPADPDEVPSDEGDKGSA